MHSPRFSRSSCFCWACVVTALIFSATLLRVVQSASAAETAATVEARSKQTIEYLSSDELEGRGVDTQGINKAADYLAAEFKKLGLKTDLYDGTPFQKFTMTVGAELGAKNSLAIVGPPGPDGKPRRYELKLGTDYTPLSLGGSGKIDVPLAYVGYGITAKLNMAGHGDAAKEKPAEKKDDAKTPVAQAPGSSVPAEKKTDAKAREAKKPADDKKPADSKKPAAAPVVDPHSFEYDDYAGVDVKGKVVIAMRHEPEQDNPHSFFNGTDHSPFAPFTRKMSNAYDHGVAAVVFVTDDHEIQDRLEARRKLWQQAVDELTEAREKYLKEKKPTDAARDAHRKQIEKLANDILAQGKKLEEERDPLLEFRGAGGSGESARLPTVHVRRAVIDRILADAGRPTLTALEAKIDEGPTPASFLLEGWRIEGEINVRRVEAEVKNVLAVLEGDGPHADETIILGAHYDHLGRGGEGSFVPTVKEVHNGADDNASGTTALLECARLLSASGKKPARRIVFMAFTGEERGLIGSARYCKEPLFPLEKTVAMLNMDMVGRLRDDKLTVQGCDTADEFKTIVDTLNDSNYHFHVTHQSGGFGPSDHASFYGKKIPVIHFFTGLHGDYHRPTDDADKVNVPGLVRIAHLVSGVAERIAALPERPTYREVKSSSHGGAASRSGTRPYFGSIPDYSGDQPGLALSGVTKDGPADKAGLKSGDVIVKLGGTQITNIDDFDSALRLFKGGDKVEVVAKRDGKDVKLTVTLGAPR